MAIFKIFCFLIFFQISVRAQPVAVKKVTLLMGSRFELTSISEDESLAWRSVEAACEEILRIEKTISSWDQLSETTKINAFAGKGPVHVGTELYDLIYRAKKVSALTNGAFDISFASIKKIWSFDGSIKVVPDQEKIDASVSNIGYQRILLNSDNREVSIPEGMSIGFGAIGKGYAANCAKKVMVEMGIKSGLVNAGGDLLAWGRQETGKPWKIGVADPNNKSNMVSWLEIGDMAVVTSGNYEKFVEIDGVRYSHIIDPRTGWPAKGLKSATVICPDAELADALATGVFVLGVQEGMKLINQIRGVECVMITDENKVRCSDKLQFNYYHENDVNKNALSHTLGEVQY